VRKPDRMVQTVEGFKMTHGTNEKAPGAINTEGLAGGLTMTDPKSNGLTAGNSQPVKTLTKSAADFIALFTTWSIFDAWAAGGLCIVATVALRGCV